MEFSHRNIVQKSIIAHLSPEATKKADVEPCSLVKLYTACIKSVLKYSCQVFHTSLPQYLSDEVERIQKRALKTIFPDLNYKEATAKAKLGTLFERRETLCQMPFNQIETTYVNKRHKLWNLLPAKRGPRNRERRHKRVYSLSLIKTNRLKNSFIMHHAAKATW